MLTVQLEEADIVNAAALATRWGVKMWLPLLCSTAILFGFGVWALSSSALLVGVFFIFLPIWVWFMIEISKFVLIPRKARTRFRQSKGLQRLCTISPEKDTLNIQAQTGYSNIPWSDFLKWRENEYVFLIYSPNGTYRVIPKRVFLDPNAGETFRQTLQEKIGPENKQSKNIVEKTSMKAIS